MPMTKLQAIFEIAAQANLKRNSRTSYKRMQQALTALGVTDPEWHTVLRGFEYINDTTGQVRPEFLQPPKVRP